MTARTHHHLKPIRFAGELLPHWARLLDLASRLCPLPEDMSRWFSRFTAGNGSDDSRTILHNCKVLRASVYAHKESLLAELRPTPDGAQPSQIVAAWLYSLDTMIQQAESLPTCSWVIEGVETLAIDDSDGDDITLRRV